MVSIEQEATLVAIRKDQFFEEVHLKSKWKNKSIFVIALAKERRRIQMGSRAPKSFRRNQELPDESPCYTTPYKK